MNNACALIIKEGAALASTFIIRYNIKRDDLTFPPKIYESIFIEVDKSIFNTNRNVIIGEIYNPPSSKLKCFNTNLENILNKIKNEKKYAFLMGDYNVNTVNELKMGTTQMQNFSNIFSTFYYHKLINLPTRERKQSSTLLDNIYTNIPDCYDTGTSGILKFLTQSDHYPIFTIRNTKPLPKPIEYIKKIIIRTYPNLRNPWQKLTGTQ